MKLLSLNCPIMAVSSCVICSDGRRAVEVICVVGVKEVSGDDTVFVLTACGLLMGTLWRDLVVVEFLNHLLALDCDNEFSKMLILAQGYVFLKIKLIQESSHI